MYIHQQTTQSADGFCRYTRRSRTQTRDAYFLDGQLLNTRVYRVTLHQNHRTNCSRRVNTAGIGNTTHARCTINRIRYTIREIGTIDMWPAHHGTFSSLRRTLTSRKAGCERHLIFGTELGVTRGAQCIRGTTGDSSLQSARPLRNRTCHVTVQGVCKIRDD